MDLGGRGSGIGEVEVQGLGKQMFRDWGGRGSGIGEVEILGFGR